MVKPPPDHEEKRIRHYVELEALDPESPDDQVTLVQRVASYRLLGTNYDVYDVHTSNERWWVITDPTNLYDQKSFPKYDTAFSFHVGLMMRMSERQSGELEDERAELTGAAWRRVESAREAMDSARESEDYQGIAIKCREALIAFVRLHQDAEWLTHGEPRPKAADFKGWATLYAQSLADGRMRRYLSDVADKTWDIAVSLQHAGNATVWDAEILIAATDHLFDVFSTAIVKANRTPPRRCPRCDSNRISDDGDVSERNGIKGWQKREACGACSYRGDYVFTPWELESERESEQ